MRNEIKILLAGSLLLNACAPLVVKAQSPDTETPKATKPFFDPTTTFITPTIEAFEIPTLSKETLIPTPEATFKPDIKYFSQLNYPNEHFKDGTPWSVSGCGLMVGAMLTKTDPYTYYNEFLRYLRTQGLYGEERITLFGSLFEDHKAVLGNLDYRFEEILATDGGIDRVKLDIEKYTNQGIPVWIVGSIWTGDYRQGHFTLAVGINDQGEIIYNDPIYGEGATIAESPEEATQRTQTHWITFKKFFAVFPPNQ